MASWDFKKEGFMNIVRVVACIDKGLSVSWFATTAASLSLVSFSSTWPHEQMPPFLGSYSGPLWTSGHAPEIVGSHFWYFPYHY